MNQQRTPAIIVDLDGTLYDARERQDKYIRNAPKKDFDGFHRAAKDDAPNWWCLQLVQAMRTHGWRMLFVSGRDEAFREETIAWLQQHLFIDSYDYKLLMRPTGDYTADDLMKEKMYHEYIEPHFSVLFCVDDRKRVVDMWRRLGLTCLHCDEGNF